MRTKWLIGLLLCFLGLGTSATALDDALVAQLRRGHHVILIRHALAPGTGDPATFDLADCATQRNLDERGRQQAINLGNHMRALGIRIARVKSSEWCRCLETAALAFPDYGVERTPSLNSFFGADRRSLGPKLTAQTRDLISVWTYSKPSMAGNLVLVTHQVNITALTGIFPQSGEAIIAQWDNDRLTVKGRLQVE